jgi:hypothetical protein
MNVDWRSAVIGAMPQVLVIRLGEDLIAVNAEPPAGNSAEQGVLHLSVRISRFVSDFRRLTKREIWVGTAHRAAYARACQAV